MAVQGCGARAVEVVGRASVRDDGDWSQGSRRGAAVNRRTRSEKPGKHEGGWHGVVGIADGRPAEGWE